MVKNIRHVGIVVQDLEACRNFFIDLLGFSVQRGMEEKGPHLDAMLGLEKVEVSTLKLVAPQGGVIELLKFRTHSDNNTVWKGKIFSTGLTHIALSVTNLDQCYTELSKKGFAFTTPPQHSPDGKVKVTFCRGPEGLILELVEEL